MKPLTKKDFSCWGNGDKYDDELYISHDPKITAREIADEILKNQNIVKQLKKHYVGTSEHISDCAVCSYLKPIMKGKK